MMVKSGLEFVFYFDIQWAPLEIAVKLPGQFSHSGQIFLHWGAATLNFKIKNSRPLFIMIFKSKMSNVKDSRF